MHAYILIGSDFEQIDLEIQKFSGKEKAKVIEFPFSKIADVRELQKFTKLSLSEKTAIVLKNIDKATTEALNAFLKNLEEPPKNLIYILTASDTENLPDTILSRCQVFGITNYELKITNQIYEQFLNKPINDKFETISKIKNREEAGEFLDNLIKSLHGLIIKGKNLSDLLAEAILALKNIKANGNIQLQLTNFIMHID